MAEAGKGSRPRPYSVSQDEFANNFDRIFGQKKEPKTIEKLIFPDGDNQEWDGKECSCHRCIKEKKLTQNGIPLGASRMILCPECGNKRCPKASDHTLECTNSNEPGQPGSIYQ